MSAPADSQPINKEAFKVLALSIGIREAARQTGIKEDTACKWASRGGWMNEVRAARAQADKVLQRSTGKPVAAPAQGVSTVRTAGSTAANVLAELGERTRLGLSRAAARGADTAARLDGDQVLAASRNLKDLASMASTLHGWQQAAQVGVQVNFGAISVD